jgi:hypothetical protein
MAFSFQNWLKKPTSKTARRALRRRLFVEQLEDRRLLSAPVLPTLPPVHPNVAASSSASAALNLFSTGPGQTPGPTGYTPAQMRQAYGFNLLTGLPGNNYNNAGKGETIAIVDVFNDPDISHDVQQFDETFNIGGAAGNPANTGFLKVVNQYGGNPDDVPGPGHTGWSEEESIDVEWAHAIAPGANILLVEAANQDLADEDAAVQYAAGQPNVCVVSMSYDQTGEFANEYLYDSLYTTPVGHQGVAFVADSGDYGAPEAWQTVSPNVIAVGGTTLPADQNGNPDRSLEIGWSLGSDANYILADAYIASGGGISQYEAQPPYQQGIVTQTTIYRTGPDVAYDADPATGIPIYDSLDFPPATPWAQYGGTSIAAPQWAALVAIADQARAANGEPSLDGATQLLPALYQIDQTDSHAFHDITQGYNGYSAGPGYNLVTGLGTPNAQYLIPDLVKIDSSPAAPATVYWTGDAGDDNWDNPENWSYVDPARRNVPQWVLPGPNDNVVIDLVGAVVNHSITRYDTVRSLMVTAQNVMLNLDSGTLDLSGSGNLGTFQAESPGDVVNLMGGVLKSADVSSGTTITVPPSATGLLDGGVFNGTLQALEGSTLDLEGSWTNNGSITAGTGSTLVLGDYCIAAASDPGADEDAWVNQGMITANNATVWLGGWLTDTATNLGSLALGTDTVELIGTLDNRQHTLALVPGETSSTGSWSLIGGRIDGGTITTAGGAALVATYVPTFATTYGATLDGVTLNGTLDMSAAGAFVAVVDGLTLNTDLYLDGGELQFNDGSTVAVGPLVQSATIYLGGGGLYNVSSSNLGLNNYPSQTVTVGRHVTISGPGYIQGPIGNEGTIEQNSAGQLTVAGLVNDGSIEAGQGGTVTLECPITYIISSTFSSFTLGPPWSNNADGTITAAHGATLNLYDEWTNKGRITVDATSTVSLGNYSDYVDNGNVSSPSYIWKNSGTLAAAAGATVNLGDYFTTDEFESGFQNLGVHLHLSQYTVNLIGTIDNSPADNPATGGTLTLNASTGPLYLAGGEIDGGTITGTAPLVATSATDPSVYPGVGGTLDGVVVDGTISVPASTSLTLQGNWSTTARGSITATGATLNLYDTWTNNGTITADAASTVSLGNYSYAVSGAGDTWKNSGTLAIAAGATINLGDFFTADEFESGFRQLGANLNLSQYTVNLIGTIDNSAADNPMTRGTLALDASTGPLFFSGQIDQGTITTSGSDDLVATSANFRIAFLSVFFVNGTLDGVTLNGTLDMSAAGAYVVVVDGLTLDTDLYVSGASAALQFPDGSTVAAGPLVKSATIHLSGDDAELFSNTLQTVTIGRGIIISGESPNSEIGGPIDNLGTIEQNGAGVLTVANGLVNGGSIQASNGGVVTIESEQLYFNSPATFVPWSNQADGTITATQGATLNLYDEWTNRGTITVDSSSTVSLGTDVAAPFGIFASVARYIWTNSGTLAIAPGATVNLGDYFTTDDFENHFQQLGVNLDLDNYTVNLIGTIDNSAADNPITGGTLALNHSTGPLNLAGGTINQGTISTRGSDDLVATNTSYTYDYYEYYFFGAIPIGGGTLNGVTLDGTLDMSEPSASLTVMNGLTLNTDLNLSGAGASLQFYDSTGSSLAGDATVYLSGDNASISNFGIQAVIIGQGITISGESANSSISGPIDNLGTVAQDSAGQMTVTGLVNSGTVTVASGGTVTEQGLFVNAGTVTIAAGGTFSTSGADYTQWTGTTIVDGLLSAANVNLTGGLLTGAGTIQANVTNAATVDPGDPFGTLTIQGNYTQTAAGVLVIQIGGPNQLGQLAVTGSATLDGTLEVSLAGSYIPAVGTSFPILTFSQYSGDFATELGLRLPHHRFLSPVWDSGDLTLTVSN